jgi:hypothetical protein
LKRENFLPTHKKSRAAKKHNHTLKKKSKFIKKNGELAHRELKESWILKEQEK